jgi:predicted exporter
LRAQWLGHQNGADVSSRYASVILVRGLNATEQTMALSQFKHAVLGVKWVDRTADISHLLEHFRTIMAGLLVVGHIAVLMALLTRFKRSAWRAWLPCALASLLTVAMLGYMNEPLQLFNLLALMLLLGMGVDYGIFLLEHPGEGQGFAWLAVLVGAISTGLSFGLLALSSTPALRAFGLTMLIGLSTVCFIAPLLRLTPQEETALT